MEKRCRCFGRYLVVLFAILITDADGQQTTPIPFPEPYRGDWYSIDQGVELHTLINAQQMKNEKIEDSICVGVNVNNSTIDAHGDYDAKIVVFNKVTQCYQCFDIYHRTVNVLQYKQTTCQSQPAGRPFDMNYFCQSITPTSDILTMFRIAPQTINCKTTWEGTFHFTYEVDFGGGGICDSPGSAVVACQEPGSVYVDNQVFSLYFGKCLDVTTSLNQKIRFMCMGSWTDTLGNIYSAMADIGRDQYRDRFRCMLTRNDQQYADNSRYFALSRWAECSTLKSPYDGPFRLKMWPAYIGSLGAIQTEQVYGTQLVTPACNFPRNFTGRWFTTAEFDSEVRINATHIYFKTKLDMYTFRESVFACQQYRDSRYLVTAVTIGRCEVDYVCFDFMPRHHSVIRWRMSEGRQKVGLLNRWGVCYMRGTYTSQAHQLASVAYIGDHTGKPYRLSSWEMGLPNYLERKFRQACTWSSFTLNRDKTDWNYYTFILDPPAPVPCPIGGRYNFTQIGLPDEKYVTRVRGITERPRHMLDCFQYVSELKSCDSNPKKISVDAEYCATLDHTGKPIGEYEIADHELNCVGYWLEDMKSYMITYDMEDAVSAFRCWVYERRDWRDIYMSRAIRAACNPLQTAYSSTAAEGASLALVLKESERLWDSCPQRYDTGANPYQKEMLIYVLDDAASIKFSALQMVLLMVALRLFTV